MTRRSGRHKPQNVIAVLSDLDHTLSPVSCQWPIFDLYRGSTPLNDYETAFWAEVGEWEKKLALLFQDESGFDERLRIPKVQRMSGNCKEFTYANFLLHKVRTGEFKDLSRAKLRELGQQLKFFPGVPEFIPEMKDWVQNHEEWSKYGIKLEFYIVSAGIAEMIRGSSISQHCNGIFATEFIPEFGGDFHDDPIAMIASPMTHTEKGKYVYMVCKGFDYDVNQRVDHDQRRVSGECITTVIDGPSDIVFSAATKDLHGECIGVYKDMQVDIEKHKFFRNAAILQKDGRVRAIAPADYNPNTHLRNVLEHRVVECAEFIMRSYADKGREIPSYVNE